MSRLKSRQRGQVWLILTAICQYCLAYATPVGALVGVCGGIAYILREARQMQNNLADSQHLENGVWHGHKNIQPPVIVKQV